METEKELNTEQSEAVENIVEEMSEEIIQEEKEEK